MALQRSSPPCPVGPAPALQYKVLVPCRVRVPPPRTRRDACGADGVPPSFCLASSLDLVFTVWCASLGLQAALLGCALKSPKMAILEPRPRQRLCGRNPAGKKRVLGELAFDERDYHCRVRSTAPGGLQREKERLVCAKVIPYSHLSELGTLSPPGSSWRWPTCSF